MIERRASRYKSFLIQFSSIYPDFRSIWNQLQRKVMAPPDEEKWLNIANDFKSIWHFPNCVGAIDGKHVLIQAPSNSGSLFFNYKRNFSTVLLAVAHASYRFVYVDIGSFGKQSDGSIFANSFMGKALASQTILIPKKNVVEGNTSLPYVFVGDEAFPLKNYLMRPFPGSRLNSERRVYNYRLSRARRTIENAFGIMTSKFRVLRRPISLSPNGVDEVVKACCVLHNLLRDDQCYFSSNSTDSTCMMPNGGRKVKDLKVYPTMAADIQKAQGQLKKIL